MKAAAAALLACAALVLGAADGEAERARRGGTHLVSNWHLGPFFEYRRAEPGDATFWALRPFYSQVRDPATRTEVRDALWPLATFHDHADASWWSAFVLLHGDARATDPTWSFNVYPFLFCGVDRHDVGYWGFFPFYGHHPHFALMDDWSFVLWPIWHTYEVKGVRSHAVCWPFVTWRDEPRAGVGVWPFYGQARLRESDHRYILWPLVTWASYDEDRDTSGVGSSWWCLPFYGEVRRARESQTMVLPPFFSYTETFVPSPSRTRDDARGGEEARRSEDDVVLGDVSRSAEDDRVVTARRWRLPWPFVDFESTTLRDRISVFPFWEQVRGFSYSGQAGAKGKVEERTWRIGWKLVENTELTTERTRESRFNFFPFFTWEHLWADTNTRSRIPSSSEPRTSNLEPQTSNLKLQTSYFRLWPFWSSETVQGRTHQRTLELMPIRHVEGVERNWAPFWSLWEKDERPDGRTRYSLLWNFIAWSW